MRIGDGRIDALSQAQKHIYIIEFKLNGSAQKALDQIKDKNYSLPFRDLKDSNTIHLVGINFSFEKRNIQDWKEELL